MQRWQIGAALVLSSAALTGSAARQAAAPIATAPVWLSDVEAARATSLRTGKPLFVAFR